MNVKQIFLILFLGFTTIISAQNNALSNAPIDAQFDYILENSNRYQDFKVVKRVWIEKLKANVADSIKAVETKLNSETQKVASQQAEISKLQADLAAVNQKITDLNTEKDSISLLGIQLSKSTYQSVVWGIIAVLALLLIIYIYRFKSSNTITKDAKAKLAETETEFEEHRKRALEREQQVRRKLQDEINKNKAS